MIKLITNVTLALAIVATVLAAPSAYASTSDVNNPTETCGTINVEIKSFGAGLMYQPRPIAIAGEHLTAIDIAGQCAVVSWVTDMPATSQVIFTEATETIDMDATVENLGFAQASTQNNSANVVHSAILKDLTPGKSYTYRVVSRSHPTAIPSVSQAYTMVMPKMPTPVVTTSTVPTVVDTTATTSTPTVEHTTMPVVIYTEVPAATPSELPNSPTTVETAALEDTVVANSMANLANVPAAITAATDVKDTPKSTFWSRIKQAFSFFKRSNTVNNTDSVQEMAQESPSAEGAQESVTIDTVEEVEQPTNTKATDESVKTTDDTTVINPSSFVARAGFLIPTLFILLFIFLIQQIALPMLGVIVERPLVFWMFSVILVAIASGLLKYYKLTLVMIAIFLGLLAWYLLNEATDEVNEAKKVEEK